MFKIKSTLEQLIDINALIGETEIRNQTDQRNIYFLEALHEQQHYLRAKYFTEQKQCVDEVHYETYI